MMRKTVAAAVLRGVAATIKERRDFPDPEQTARDLCLIADDYILGEAKWGKGGKYPPEVQKKINFFASIVEQAASRGERVGDAYTTAARELARLLKCDYPKARDELRDAIEYARKAGRKARRVKGK